MPDVQQGLSNAVDDGSDPNTDAGFEAALAKAVGKEAPAATEETAEAGLSPDIAAGLETAEESSGPERGPDGRFLPKEAAAEGSEGEVEGAAPETVEESGDSVTDPELDALLARHGGDVNAALVALVEERRNRETVIGRQGDELGQLRQRMERLESAREEPQAPQVEAGPLPSQRELVDAISEYGFEVVMQDVLNRFPGAIELAMDAGLELEDPAARQFERRYIRNLAAQQAAPDPFIEQQKAQQELANVVVSELSANFDAKLHAAIKDQIPAVMPNIGPLVSKGLVSSDPGERAEAVRFILRDAASRVSTEARSQATQDQAAAAAVKAAAKRQTAVATGSLRPVPQGQAGGELTSEERQRIFKEQLLGTETTSVSEGLTYGK